MSTVLSFLIALVVTMALMPMLMRYAMRIGLVDQPAARKVHSRPIPRVGGVAMAGGIGVALLLAGVPDRFTVAYLAAGATLLVFGALDDRFDLDYRIKFLGQFLAIGIIVAAGGLMVSGLTLSDHIALPAWIALPLTVLFVLGVTNAVNLADGLDGLAGGTTFLSIGALGFLAHGSGLIGLTAVAFAAAGAVLGFLRFNTHPASVFMGDAGSQLLGFTLAVLGVAVTQDAGSVYSTAIPVLLAGIPILDTLSVMAQRFIEKRPMFKADRNHLHHKLLGLGFDQRESVTLIYAAQIVLFVAAYLLRFESDLVIVGVYLGFCATVITTLHWAQRRGWQLRASGRAVAKGPLSRIVDRLEAPEALQAWSTPALAAGLAGYALVVVLQVRSLASDSMLLAAALLGTLVVAGLLWRRSPLHMLEKAVCYVSAALLVYVDATLPEGARWIPWLDWLLPMGVAVVTALRLRWSGDRRFELTPLDLLIVFMALIVPSLPGLMQLPPGAPLGVAKIIVMFYAIELLAGGGVKLAPFLRLGSTLVLVGLCLRPFLGAAL